MPRLSSPSLARCDTRALAAHTMAPAIHTQLTYSHRVSLFLLAQSPYSDLDGRLNRQIMGTIYKKRVYCRHRALGCLVEMEIGHENRNIIAHRQMCIFESVVCEQCHTQVQRGHIDRHNQEECPARQKTRHNIACSGL